MKSIIKAILREGFELLTEITVNDAWTKFYSDKTKFPVLNGNVELFNALNQLYSEDGRNFNKGIFNWLYSLRKNNQLKDEDFYKAKDYIRLFNKFINRIPQENRDITKYRTLPQLYNVVQGFEGGEETMSTSNTQELKQIKEKEVKKVYEDDKWLIMIPLTERASCLIGKGTQWCTAADKSNNQFDYHNNQGPLYVIVNKDDDEKYQIHFESGQLMDEKDRPVDVSYFFENIVDSEVLDYFEANIPKFWEFVLEEGAEYYADSGYSDIYQQALNNVKEGQVLDTALQILRNGSDPNAVSDGFYYEKKPDNIDKYQIKNLIERESEEGEDSHLEYVFNHLIKIGYNFDDVTYNGENNIIKTYLDGKKLLDAHHLETGEDYEIDNGKTLRLININYGGEIPKFIISIDNKIGSVDIDTLVNLIHQGQLFESKTFIKTILRKHLLN